MDIGSGLAHVQAARETIRDVVYKTPLMRSSVFSQVAGGENTVYLKCENLQLTGAYKIRGALNKIRSLTTDQQRRGVVCSSAGNHAQGVAFAAAQQGVNATIVMPIGTPFLKARATEKLGGKVVLHGAVYDDAYREARRIEHEQNAVFVHPFDDLQIIYGQGTIGLEILEKLPSADIIVCPVGGGGLISGVAMAAKALNPNVQIIGVQAEGASAMEQSFARGRIVNLDQVRTIADGIAVKCPGETTFELVQKYVDDFVTVTDSEIVESFFMLSEKHKLLAEAAGVAALAALPKLGVRGKNIVVIISGGNIDMVTMSGLINSALVSRGRLFCFSVELQDKPGELVKVASLLADAHANVVHLEHNQFKAKDKLHNVVLEVTAETNGNKHIARIRATFADAGYQIRQLY